MRERQISDVRFHVIKIHCIAFLSAALASITAVQRQPGETEPAPQAPSQRLQIDWTSAHHPERAPIYEVNCRFFAADRKAIDKMPSDPDLAAGLRLFRHGESHTVSSKTATMAFTLTRSGRAFRLPSNTAKTMPKGELTSLMPADGILIEHTRVGYKRL